ncbi:MAG: GNAT family N-acetyltransferase [Bacteroidetes bacterium]|nr:GNAT family N-acetyltransferase [Bacteroidota bacterium]
MQSPKLNITNSELTDLPIIFSFFESAIQYQKKKGYELWPQFSQELITNEINKKQHLKIVNGNTIVCVFSVMYNDPVIWKEKDIDPSVYLHRIAINPLFKGNYIMKLIKEWALEHAKLENKKFVRMDTWGNNENLRNYYIACGFNYIGQQYLTETPGIPAHYGGNILSLFELEV